MHKGILTFLMCCAALSPWSKADDHAVYPLALLPFQERGVAVEGQAEKVSDLLFALLAGEPDLYLVERAELQSALDEQQLSLSGLVRPDEAVRVGQLTGAKVLVTGSVIEASGSIYLVAKLIGTETSRVAGTSVKGTANESLSELVERLAQQVSEAVTERAAELVAKPRDSEDQIAEIRNQLGDLQRPSLCIVIEERHIGQPTVDPAAQTELVRLCKETGFMVLDAASGGRHSADVLITGEGFSEVAARQHNLVSVKARIEAKAVERVSGRVLASSSETVVEVGLAENIAGKSALERAAGNLARRLLPSIAKSSAELSGSDNHE